MQNRSVRRVARTGPCCFQETRGNCKGLALKTTMRRDSCSHTVSECAAQAAITLATGHGIIISD